MHFLPAINDRQTITFSLTSSYIDRKTQWRVNYISVSPYNELRGSCHDDVDGWMPERYALQASCQLLPAFLEIDAHLTQDSGIACTHANTHNYHVYSTPTKIFTQSLVCSPCCASLPSGP